VRAAAGNVVPDIVEMGKGLASLPAAAWHSPKDTALAAAQGLYQPYVDIYNNPEQQMVEHPVGTALSLIPFFGAAKAFLGGMSAAGLRGGVTAAARSLVPPLRPRARPQVLHTVPHPTTGLPHVTPTPAVVEAVQNSGLSRASQRVLLKNRKFHKTLQDVADAKGTISPATVREAALREGGVNPENITRSMAHREAPVGATRGQRTGAQAYADSNRAAAREAVGLTDDVAAPAAPPPPQPIGDFRFKNGQWESPNGTYVGDRANADLSRLHEQNFGYDPSFSGGDVAVAPRATGVKGVAQEILSEDPSTYGPSSVTAPRDGGGLATHPIINTGADALLGAMRLPFPVNMLAEGAKNLAVSSAAKRAGTAASAAERLEAAGADAARNFSLTPGQYYGGAGLTLGSNIASSLGRDQDQQAPEQPPAPRVNLVPEGLPSGVPVPHEKLQAEARAADMAQSRAPAQAQADDEYSDDYSYRPPAQQAEPGMHYGGRTAYKSGGKVTSGIEPLVQRLMTGYKKAKMAEQETTKPLLNHHDQTIVRALRVAKKAI